jgi:GNAT superfamily N-acetyltransferase/hypoxanthine-guanine phosphoribosyltransferase
LKTVYIGREEVDAYAKDLAARLIALGEDCPRVWCPIGHSGDYLVRRVAPFLPADLGIQIVEVSYNKSTGVASFKDASSKAELAGKSVLVLDSSVHSGGSMLACIRLAESAKARQVLSYSLVIKRSARFIPHYFGVVVGDHDRTLFLLDKLPNNRLYTTKYKPLGLLRKICDTDVARDVALNTGVESLDKISWGDLFYEHKANGYDVYVVEDCPRMAGFIKLKLREGRSVSIGVLATDQDYQGKGIGGALMRFAETLGRSNQCKLIDLWAIENKVEMYKALGYEVKGETIDAGGGELYSYMQKELLYHFTLADDDHPPVAR